MTGNKEINIRLQNMFLNLCIGISIVMFGVIIYSRLIAM